MAIPIAKQNNARSPIPKHPSHPVFSLHITSHM